jgi:hypothetical protein
MMPRSDAWRSFQKARGECNLLLKIASAADDTLHEGYRISLREQQLRLFVVALIGNLQAYVSERLEEACDGLPNTWDALNPVQRRYVSAHIHRRCSRLIVEHPEVSLLDERRGTQFIRQLVDCTNWSHDPSSLSASVLKEDLDGFLGDNGSKSLSRALTLHRPDGMRFSDWLGAQPPHRTTLDILDNAIRLRNDAAHGKVEQRVTLEDARRYRAIVTRIVQKADEYIGG